MKVLIFSMITSMIAARRGVAAWAFSRRVISSPGKMMAMNNHNPQAVPISLKRSSEVRRAPSSISSSKTKLFSEPNSSSSSNSSNNNQESSILEFQPGDKIQVEVVSFGPLGASVEVIGMGHEPNDLIPENEPPLALGLILQKEISYFRQGRDNVDVVRGEVLPAYVERFREDTGRIDIALRAYGGKAKAQEAATVILERLQEAPDGLLQIGDKSPPGEIAAEFPGISKGAFKRAVAGLYKEGKVKPNPFSIELM